MKKIILLFIVIASLAKQSQAQIITTVAGYTSTAGYSGNGGQATAAELNQPEGIVFDATGNFYFSDLNNNCNKKGNNFWHYNNHCRNRNIWL